MLLCMPIIRVIYAPHLLAHCHRKLNIRSVFDISSDPILFTNAGNLENILKKLQAFLDEDKIVLNGNESQILQDAKMAIEKRQQSPSSLDRKEWDRLFGEIVQTYLFWLFPLRIVF